MKNITIFLTAFLALALAGCEDNANLQQEGGQEMKTFRISATVPQTITTYSSEKGGVNNVKEDDYDLRFIMEVYTKDDPAKLAYRGHEIVSSNFKNASVSFEVNLLAAEYSFVFWADFVEKGSTKDLYYKTSASTGKEEEDVEATSATVGDGLTAIEIIPNVLDKYDGVNNNARDAYYEVKEFDLRYGDIDEPVELHRPFGKFRLLSLDAPQNYDADLEMLEATLTYSTVTLPAGFNALLGETTAATVDASAVEYTAHLVKEETPVGGETKNVLLMAYDYLFAAPGQTVNFDVVAKDGNAALKSRKFTNIPIAKNKLTTVIGNFFTGTETFSVNIDDNFEGELDARHYDPGVEINGLLWATRNVGKPGEFAESVYENGGYYQWNNSAGWYIDENNFNEGSTATYPFDIANTYMTQANELPNNSYTWNNNICPQGWRIPTAQEWWDMIATVYDGVEPNTNELGIRELMPAYIRRLENGTVQYNTDFGPESKVVFKANVIEYKGQTLVLPCAGVLFPSVPTVWGVNIENLQNGNGNYYAYYWTSDSFDGTGMYGAWSACFEYKYFRNMNPDWEQETGYDKGNILSRMNIRYFMPIRPVKDL